MPDIKSLSELPEMPDRIKLIVSTKGVYTWEISLNKPKQSSSRDSSVPKSISEMWIDNLAKVDSLLKVKFPNNSTQLPGKEKE